MNMQLADITIVLDKSPSMAPKVGATCEGFNAFIEQQKQLPGECRVSLIQFSSGYDYLTTFADRDIREVPKLDHTNYAASGNGTALLDAIGKTVNAMGQKYSNMPEYMRPGVVILAILTDGEENSSREFANETIQHMLKVQQDVYKWKVFFLAAGQDAIKNADKIGVLRGHAINYNDNPVGTRQAYQAMTCSVASARSGHDSKFLSAHAEDYDKGGALLAANPGQPVINNLINPVFMGGSVPVTDPNDNAALTPPNAADIKSKKKTAGSHK